MVLEAFCLQYMIVLCSSFNNSWPHFWNNLFILTYYGLCISCNKNKKLRLRLQSTRLDRDENSPWHQHRKIWWRGGVLAGFGSWLTLWGNWICKITWESILPGFTLSICARAKSGAANQHPRRDHWQLQAGYSFRWEKRRQASMEATCHKQTIASPEEVSVDTVTASVLSELESISASEEEQRMVLKTFLHGKDVFTLLPTGVWADWLK